VDSDLRGYQSLLGWVQLVGTRNAPDTERRFEIAGRGVTTRDSWRRDVAAFFKTLRASLGGNSLAYLWTAEWHKSGHGLHVHFAVGRIISRGKIEAAWPHGFVHIKLLGDLPVGSGAIAEARLAARYLSKYVGKDFDAARMPGLHRYEVAEGFQPKPMAVWGATREQAIDTACQIMKGAPETIWSSTDKEGWLGPPAVWLQWRG